MTRGILDTSVLIATDVEPIPGELAISVISIAELQFGVLVAKDPQARGLRLSRLSAIQRRFDPLPVDDAVADSYAQLAARVVRLHPQPGRPGRARRPRRHRVDLTGIRSPGSWSGSQPHKPRSRAVLIASTRSWLSSLS